MRKELHLHANERSKLTVWNVVLFVIITTYKDEPGRCQLYTRTESVPKSDRENGIRRLTASDQKAKIRHIFG